MAIGVVSAAARDVNRNVGLLQGPTKWMGRGILFLFRTPMAVIKSIEDGCRYALNTKSGKVFSNRVYDLTKTPCQLATRCISTFTKQFASNNYVKMASNYISQVPHKFTNSISTENLVRLRQRYGSIFMEEDLNLMIRLSIQEGLNFDDPSLCRGEVVGARPFFEQLQNLCLRSAGRLGARTLNDLIGATQREQHALIHALEKFGFRKGLDQLAEWMKKQPQSIVKNFAIGKIYKYVTPSFLHWDPIRWAGDGIQTSLQSVVQAPFNLGASWMNGSSLLSAGTWGVGWLTGWGVGFATAQVVVQPLTLACEWGPTAVKAYSETMQRLDREGAVYWQQFNEDPNFLLNLWTGEELANDLPDLVPGERALVANVAGAVMFQFLDRLSVRGEGLRGLLGLALQDIWQNRGASASASMPRPQSPEQRELVQSLKAFATALLIEFARSFPRRVAEEGKMNVIDAMHVIEQVNDTHLRRYPRGFVLTKLGDVAGAISSWWNS